MEFPWNPERDYWIFDKLAIYKHVFILKRKMLLNTSKIENNQLVTPRISLPDDRRRIAVLSFQCELENKMDKTSILCLRSNLVIRNACNPDQIMCYISVKKNDRFIDFCPSQVTPWRLSTNRLSGGFLYLTSLETHEEIPIVQAALQLTIRAPGEN